ncbi:MAG: hypothetical protein ABIV50_04935 [Opitutus sp.]
MKTARFVEVVEKSGRPETYLLWVPAARDKRFQRAVKDHRIMTVHQELRGAKKDYGVVGFHEEDNAQYLLFPKSLRRFDERRVIGIDYELLGKGQPAQSNKASAPTRKASALAKSAKKESPASTSLEKAGNVVAFAPPAAKPDDNTLTKPHKAPPAVQPKLPSKHKHQRTPESSTNPSRLIEQTKSSGTIPPSTLRELGKVLKELRAGKGVVAYERLEAVVKGAKAK